MCYYKLVIVQYCQTTLQLANQTQLQLVGEGVDLVFPQKKKEERKEEGTHTWLLAEGMTLHV